MNIQQIHFKEKNPFVETYIQSFDKVASLFSFHPFSKESLRERSSYLDQNNTYRRDELKEVLIQYNKRINNTSEAIVQIEKLSDPSSKVVIGGQQAGVLTGPLYAIYKAVQIIKMAQQAEQQLGTPVIPVYWIAGEDHDWEEVNNVYQISLAGKLEQHKLKARPEGKKSVSHIEMSKEVLHRFIEDVTEQWSQTERKNALKQELSSLAEQSETLTDFFARVMVYLFGQHGLVLIDSADKEFRSLQSDYFVQMIEKNEILHNSLLETERSFKEMGYVPQIEIDPIQSNLFIYVDGERLLLERNDGLFRTKDGAASFTRDEILALAKTEPHKLSTNVVFRALMQELIFPTLIFVGGTSEVSYWALYGKMFLELGLKLPIIVPRVGFTIVDRTTQKWMDKYQLTYEELLYDIEKRKDEWFASQDELHLDGQFSMLKNHIVQAYSSIQTTMNKINAGMKQLSDKNLEHVLREVHYLENKANNAYRSKFGVSLGHFERMKLLYSPQDKLQERVYHPFYFLNEYGDSWLSVIIEHDYPFEKQHLIIEM